MKAIICTSSWPLLKRTVAKRIIPCAEVPDPTRQGRKRPSETNQLEPAAGYKALFVTVDFASPGESFARVTQQLLIPS